MTNQTELTETAIRELLRAHIPTVIERLVKLSDSKNESISLGACRLILDKVLPNFKAKELFDTNAW